MTDRLERTLNAAIAEHLRHVPPPAVDLDRIYRRERAHARRVRVAQVAAGSAAAALLVAGVGALLDGPAPSPDGAATPAVAASPLATPSGPAGPPPPSAFAPRPAPSTPAPPGGSATPRAAEPARAPTPSQLRAVVAEAERRLDRDLYGAPRALGLELTTQGATVASVSPEVVRMRVRIVSVYDPDADLGTAFLVLDRPSMALREALVGDRDDLGRPVPTTPTTG
ncbi:MAG: hypothetical protein ACRCYR_13105 [Phycicoccus sp.]